MSSAAVSIARTAATNSAFHAPSAIIVTKHNLNGNILTGNNTNNNNFRTMTNTTTNTLQQPQQQQSLSTSTTTTNGIGEKPSKKSELAAKIIQQSHVVCFDVDSTVITEEGIDELAEFCGKGSEVARVTKEAMGGSMTFQDALKIRLNIIRPTQTQIHDFLKQRPSTLTHNVKRFITQLKDNGKQVYLISGGFDCLIAPVANELGIPLSNLYANKLFFEYNGDYVSFDETQPTSRSGGKAEAIKLIRKVTGNDTLITMIGDGATDLEAVPPANYFIGFGGNVVRAEVFKRAQYYVSDFEQLIAATNN